MSTTAPQSIPVISSYYDIICNVKRCWICRVTDASVSSRLRLLACTCGFLFSTLSSLIIHLRQPHLMANQGGIAGMHLCYPRRIHQIALDEYSAVFAPIMPPEATLFHNLPGNDGPCFECQRGYDVKYNM